ncbi:multidrug efflux system outer membrane protein [Prosthecobacter fusiformis]|uniref:Multidrug efflux system outer membrane protein n=1 Tax=Prosthecobacter fusiformis TaxID=48464 RepID=A0A4R7S660_9BACT|nr:efflux transporter outer membrane subunit [Prosthecobacter fusiformis]TDU72905.1 multidrug efflux system outer membrane protein [Prosthecobacter fusiformis]
MLTRSPLFIAALALSACTVGPDHTAPDIADITPAKWSWQTAAPRDDSPRGEWWKIFREPELDRLEALALQSSPTLHAAAARVDQARAAARISTADWLPDLRLNADGKREQTSANLPTPIPVDIPRGRVNSFSTLLDLSYEIDFWGKIRREVESARATADSTSASYHNAILTLTGDVAAQYFLLRAADAELNALRRTIALREKFKNLLDDKFKAGAIPETDFARAVTEVATAKAELADVKRQRQEASDTLALLCGRPASSFIVRENPIAAKAPPVIPAGLPAAMLERRPDVASAERTVAARNADIGVAVSAYFPAVKLTGTAGYLSNEVDTLLGGDSRVWSIGPSISLPISGLSVIRFNVKRQKAAREEAIANYRQAVLSAIRDVETSLAQTRYLREQASAVSEALAASTKATDLVRESYERGTLSYFEYLDAERTRLQTERQTAQISAQRHISTVRLIKALGGGW